MQIIDITTGTIPSDTKWAFTTRRVNLADVAGLSKNFDAAMPGDLVLGRITQIGQHKNIHLARGRASQTHVGDHVVMVLGDRYAPDQFEGFAEINPAGCDVVAAGGIIGRVVQAHDRMSAPTRIAPLGLLTDSEGDVINVVSYQLPRAFIPDDVTVLGVFGTSMNAGKTTAAAALAHGLLRAGHAVAAVKATGTGAIADYNTFADAGVPVLDFTDAGMATTYRMPLERIECAFETLVGTAALRGARVVVVEFADGVFQRETHAVLAGSTIRERIDGFVFAAGDAAGAVGGVLTARTLGIEPFLLSGLLSCSPLGKREAQAALGIPILTRAQLLDPKVVSSVVASRMRQPVSQRSAA